MGDVVSTQNNSFLARKITASLSLEIKRCDISSAPPGQEVDRQQVKSLGRKESRVV